MVENYRAAKLSRMNEKVAWISGVVGRGNHETFCAFGIGERN